MSSPPPRQPLSALPARRPGPCAEPRTWTSGQPDGRPCRRPPVGPGGSTQRRRLVARRHHGGERRGARTAYVSLGARHGRGRNVNRSRFSTALRRLARLETRPHAAWSQELLGQRSGGGFRRALNRIRKPQKSVGSLYGRSLTTCPRPYSSLGTRGCVSPAWLVKIRRDSYPPRCFLG